MMRLTPDWIGWLATAIFLASYVSKDQAKLRRIQALAAVLWVTYGAILHAVPVVVANLLVAGVALYSSLIGSAARELPGAGAREVELSRASGPDLSRIS
jgi:nitric oxide reductase large subunit